MRLRDDYVADCDKGVQRWNKAIEKAGLSYRIKLPHVAFHRQVGEFQNVEATPEGEVLSTAEWARRRDEWLPSKADGDFIQSLMQPCWEPGKYAPWIGPPKIGIDNKGGDFEYVKIHRA
jgi:benzoyl-CoA 2,3-dioxygenase component B